MQDIFLSYSEKDRKTAAQIAELLESSGWSVWWDREIPAGKTWRDTIEDALQNMRCMVVLWSNHSIKSDWVREEADEGKSQHKLIPVLIESVRPPVGFREIQAADLVHWDGSIDFPGFRQLIAILESRLSRPSQSVEQVTKSAQPPTGTQPSSRIEPDHENEVASTRTKLLTLPRLTKLWGPLAAVVLLVIIGIVGYKVMRSTQPRSGDKYDPGAIADTTMGAKDTVTPLIQPQPKLVSLTVRADRPWLNVSQRTAVKVSATYSDGTARELEDGIAFQSSDPAILSVDAQGQVQALREGKAFVMAHYENVNAEPLPITIRPKISQPLRQTQASPPAPRENSRDVISDYINGEKLRRGR